MFLAFSLSPLWVTWSCCAYTVLMRPTHLRPFLCILIDVSFYSNTHPCMYLFCTTSPVTLVFIYQIDFLISARSIITYLPLSDCHVLNPMRYLTRTRTVLARPRHPCLDHPRLISRPLSSLGAVNPNRHLYSPVTDDVPRFDWRLRVPSPKPPLSTVQKALERRVQPPLPTNNYPYDAHIQKYKDQSVTRRVLSLPFSCSPRSSLQFPPPFIIRACGK